MSDKILADILGYVQETSSSVKDLDKNLELHKQKMEHEIARINELDEQQNKILQEHIEGVQTLKSMYVNHREETHARLEKLEEPRKFLRTVNKIILALGALAAAGYGIYQFWELFKG